VSAALARRLAVLLLAAACSALAARARAHAPFTVVLSIRQLSDGEFLTTWERAPLADTQTSYHLLRPIFPAHCRFEPPRLSCGARGLSGQLGLAGLGDLSSSGIIHVQWLRRPRQSFSFSATQRQQAVDDASGAASSWTHGAVEFTRLGLEHILFGWDHLLFVLGLLWLVQTPARLVKTITGFTVAHSVTLTAASLGWTSVPVPPVEALIALSIAFVAAEAVKARDGVQGVTARAPWLAALAFGLLHGFGFASALAEVELPREQLPLSLLCFNLGVELGQLLFVAMVWWLRILLRRLRVPRLAQAARCLQYAAGTLAMYWFVERIAAFSAPG
jgi:hydrogenase/urease accessory protein HupE